MWNMTCAAHLHHLHLPLHALTVTRCWKCVAVQQAGPQTFPCACAELPAFPAALFHVSCEACAHSSSHKQTTHAVLMSAAAMGMHAPYQQCC